MTPHDPSDKPTPFAFPRSPRALADYVVNLIGGRGDRGSTGRAAMFAFFVRVASAGIAYLLQVLLARWMGSFEYGIFVFVWVWVLILGGLAPIGLSVTTIRFVAEYLEKQRPALLRGLLFSSRATAISVSTAVMLAGFACLAFLGPLLESYYVLPAFLILFCLPPYTAVDVQDGIARGFGWMDLALVPPYIVRSLLILAGFTGALLLGYPATAVTAAGAAIFACWVTAVAQALLMEPRIRKVVERGARQYDTRLWLLTSLPLLITHGFELLLQNTDVLVLSRYVPPSEIGIYFAALKTIGLVSFIHFAVGTAAAHRFSAYAARGDQERLAAFVRETVRWTFWPTLVLALVLLAAGKPLLWLFGPEFTAGYPVMFVLAAGFVLRAMAGPAEFILNMQGQQNACAGALFFAAGLNIALNFALIPSLGLYGAALATSISVAAAAGFMAVAARRRLGLTIVIGF